MSKDLIINGKVYKNVSSISLPLSDGQRTTIFKDPDDVVDFSDVLKLLLEGGFEDITLSDEVVSLNGSVLGSNKGLKSINVTENHPVYSSVDGVLYSKDGKTLILYPCAKEDAKYIIGKNVTNVSKDAFLNCKNLLCVIVDGDLESGDIDGVDLYVNLDADILNNGEIHPDISTAASGIIIPENTTYIDLDSFDNLSDIKGVYINSGNLELEYEMYSDGKSYDSIAGTPFSKHFRNSLKTVIIGEEVTEVLDNLCYGLYNLENVIFDGNVEKIGSESFASCRLTEVVLPDSLKEIGKYAFAYNNLKSIIIPNNVIKIGEYAFTYNENISEIILPEGLKEIGESAFSSTGIRTITIPGSVENMVGRLFSSCRKLTSATIMYGVTSIPDFMFENCINLKSVNIPDSVRTLNYGAFDNCSNLESIHIPDSVTNMGSYTFECCAKLTSIVIPKNVKCNHSYGIFQECSNLEEVIFEGNPGYLESWFYGCSNLKKITFMEDLADMNSDTFSGCSPDLIVYGPASGNLERFSDNYGYTFMPIESESENDDNIKTEISTNDYAGNTSITSVTIPASLTSIADGAFSGCSSLLNIYVEEGNTTYKDVDGVLYSSDGTSLIAYPEGRLYSGDTYVIPSTVTEIKPGALKDSDSSISNSITLELDAELLNAGGAYPITSEGVGGVIIPENATFFDYDTLTSLPRVEHVYYNAEDCEAEILRETDGKGYATGRIFSPFSVTRVGVLNNLVIGDTVKKLTDYFAYNIGGNINSVTIPASVTEICDYALGGCSKSLEITILNKDAVISDTAFSGGSSVEIHGYTGSTAETFANAKGYTFVEISE